MVATFMAGLGWYRSREPLIGVWRNETVSVEFLAPNSVLWGEEVTLEYYNQRDMEYEIVREGDLTVQHQKVSEGAVKEEHVETRGNYGLFEHHGDEVSISWVTQTPGRPLARSYQARISANGDLILRDNQKELVLKPAAGKVFPTSLVGVWAAGGAGQVIGASGFMASLSGGHTPWVQKVETLGNTLRTESREIEFTLEGGILTLKGESRLAAKGLRRVTSPFHLEPNGTLSAEELGYTKSD